MKNGKYLIIVMAFIASSFMNLSAQSVSIEIRPSEPTIEDDIYLITDVFFLGVTPRDTMILSWQGSTLIIDLYHSGGGQAMPYTDIDSVLISPLNVGTYSVIARLYEGGLADADTITFRVEEYLSVVKEKSLEPEVVLFPNPTNEEITVDFGNFFTNPKIEIYNLEGRLIEVIDTNTNNSMVTIDVSTFSHGVYLLRVNDKERSITKKFIKKRSN
ncbi:MAG TPA: T9SS type A sorting domain-containing protein [Brumimicrobium sp.]|nr:T9SS type A sorting domain-containing protein [Brumimicrobium sp.]